MGTTGKAMSSGNKKDTWQTPPWVFAAAVHFWGPFDADVAASVDNALADNFLTEKDDSLNPGVSWDPFSTGRSVVWCNPPYSRGNLKRWTQEAHRRVQIGECQTVAMLVPAATADQWWQDLEGFAASVHELQPRIPFIDPETGKPAKNTGMQGHAFVVFQRGHVGPTVRTTMDIRGFKKR